MAKVVRLPSAFVIDTKVVGVSKMNEDGSSRQEIISKHVSEEDYLLLSPEPDNIYDPLAVKVLTREKLQIGYLSREIAERLQNALNGDVDVKATVTWVSGKEIMGVGLRIELSR